MGKRKKFVPLDWNETAIASHKPPQRTTSPRRRMDNAPLASRNIYCNIRSVHDRLHGISVGGQRAHEVEGAGVAAPRT